MRDPKLLELQEKYNYTDEEISEIEKIWKYRSQVEELIKIQRILQVSVNNRRWLSNIEFNRRKNTLLGGCKDSIYFTISYYDDVLTITKKNEIKWYEKTLNQILTENGIAFEYWEMSMEQYLNVLKEKEIRRTEINEKRAKTNAERKLIKSGLKNANPLF